MYRFIKTIIDEYIYESEQEKLGHKETMEGDGWTDSGQVKFDVNRSMSNPDYRWYGKYVKYEK